MVLALLAACTDDKPPPDHTDLNPEETAVTAAPTTAPLGEQVDTVVVAQRLLDLFAHLDGEVARMLMAKAPPTPS